MKFDVGFVYLRVRHNAMKTLIIISSLLLFLSASGQKSSTTVKKDKTSTETTYIPIDLYDCIKQLDTIFADSSKTKIKALTEDEFSGRFHLSFGMWMRNNWGLWKGSRLSKYFNAKGIYHPDDMTGIIFDSYYRHLMVKEIQLDEQIKYYQDYWVKAKQDDLERKEKEIMEYNIGDTVIYNYKNGFVSKSQEDKYDNEACNAKGIIVDKDGSKFNIKVRLINGCDKKGIIYYDNKNSLILNKTTNKMEKPKKRIITYMQASDEMWFNYSDWETND